MPEIDVSEFDARLNSRECSQAIREIVGCLRKSADQAGPVVWRAHSTPGGGWGITGKRGKRLFCRFDPKPSVPHVCVSVPGAAEDELKTAGTVHRRKNEGPWVDITDMRGANLLGPLIVQAYAAAGVALNPHTKNTFIGAATAFSPSDPHDQVVEEGCVAGGGTFWRQMSDESRSVDVRKDLDARGFVYAGVIRPLDSGKSCRAEIKPLGLRGSVVYGLVVGDLFKKCGDTGRKNATLKKRMHDCARAINLVISGAIAGPFTENFKRLAPKAIEANQEIEVWAREATADECKRLQRELNGEEGYDTIRTGWANKLE